MNISERNGIVLEKILPYVDTTISAIRLSAVCRRWYELINNDAILWNRLLMFEQIEDPEYWNRVDDNDQWPLGAPCKSKNILINYRKTYYYMKNNKYKKYEFFRDDNYIIEYDGKTFLYTNDNVQKIYKITNNLQLFQQINLGINIIDSIYTNTEFIVIIYCDKIVTYRFIENNYEEYSQKSADVIGKWWGIKRGKLLASNILLGMFSNGPEYTLQAWNILDDTITLNAAYHNFIKYDNGIIYAYDRNAYKVVLYDENCELIYKINEDFRHDIFDVISTDEFLHIFSYELDLISVSNWDKATGQIRIDSESLVLDTSIENFYKILVINNNILIDRSTSEELLIECYNTKFQLLWSQTESKDMIDSIGFFYIFNKLLILKEEKQYGELILEFRDANNGIVLSNLATNVFEYFWIFKKDMLIFSRNQGRKTTILLYR